MADRLIALMGGTEAGSVPVIALADRRVNAMLALTDTDRDATLSAEEIEMAADRLDRPGHEPGHGPRQWRDHRPRDRDDDGSRG